VTVVPVPKIEVNRLFKVFGAGEEATIMQLRAGASKDDIQRRTGNIVAVNDVSFSVAEGEIFAVMGLSGSGKSTLIRCINRLIEPSFGNVLIDGEDILCASAERLRRIRLEKIAMVFQHFALFPHMSVLENVAFGLKTRGVKADVRRRRALEVMDIVGLRQWADAAPDSLSGGMRQRVGLARALAVNPEVLLMDEPFSALDPLIRRDMHRELLQIQQQFRMTIIFITHDLHEALTLGDRIAIMRNGTFVQVGTREEIVNVPADDYVAAFTKDVDRGRVLRVASVMSEADSLIIDETSPAHAEAYMRQHECTALFIVDETGRPIGLLTHRDLLRAGKDERSGIRPLLREQFPIVSDSSPIADTFGFFSDGLPIAVIDRNHRLCGKVSPTDVLATLSGRKSGRQDTELNRAPRSDSRAIAEAGGSMPASRS